MTPGEWSVSKCKWS